MPESVQQLRVSWIAFVKSMKWNHLGSWASRDIWMEFRRTALESMLKSFVGFGLVFRLKLEIGSRAPGSFLAKSKDCRPNEKSVLPGNRMTRSFSKV